MAGRPDHRAERLLAARRRRVEAPRAAAWEPSARQAGAAASGGLRAPRWETARRGARVPHAAWQDVPAADARPAARRAVRAWREVAPGVHLERAAPAAGAGPAAEPAPTERRGAPGRAGPAARPMAAADAAARADHPCLRRRGPVRPGIRPRRRPVRLAKGRGPAGRSRPATSVSCASLFPSFCFNVRVSGPSRPEPPMKRKRRESGSGSLG
jgi:hypothetical protein